MKKYKCYRRVLFLLGLFLFLIFVFYELILYSGEKIYIKKIPESTHIFDRNGVLIGEKVKDSKYRHIEIGIGDVPEFLIKAVILLEDKSFYYNNGISVRALVRASYHNFINSKNIEGGSTISSQLIRNSYGLNEKRTIERKFQEFYYSLLLNKQYSKDEILEGYLNILYFGYLNYGFESASEFYFGKSLKNLTKAEQIALIAIPKNSNKYNPITKKDAFEGRYQMLIEYFYKNKLFNEDEYKQIKSERLVFFGEQESKLPYVVSYLSGSSGNIVTTIDYYISKEIEDIAFDSINKIAWKQATDYGVLVIDRKTNEIRTMIGGVNFSGKGGQVNSVTALRQPGSALKPFTYLLAFQDFGLKPNDTVTDLPIQFETSRGYSYTPKNFSLKYKGEVSMAVALSESLNVPAVKLLNKIGISRLLDFLKQLGIASLNKDAEYYGLALTLGAGEVSLYELLQSYTIFANEGKFCRFRINSFDVENCKQIIDQKYIDDINLILTNRYFKINGFPINSNLDFEDRYVFVKTGTSRDFRDNLAVGFTENYLIGVWVGNKDGSPMKMVTGTTGAGDIFRKIVYALEKNSYENKSDNFKINKKDYLEIISPVSGSVYKFDPSKNIENQNIKLEFSTNISYTSFIWLYNDAKTDEKFIPLSKGKQTLKVILFDGEKKVGEGESKYRVE